MTTPTVHISNNRVVTTSLDIAQHFGKQHKDVLRAIKQLDCSTGFTERNFALCHKNNELQNGKPQPYYELTRDGFVFLCMGFTGAAAAQWKEAYIAAFNHMEQQLAVPAKDHARAVLAEFAPTEAQILRYHQMGLTLSEIGRLLNLEAGSVANRLKRLTALNLAHYQPSPALSERSRLAHRRKGYWIIQEVFVFE